MRFFISSYIHYKGKEGVGKKAWENIAKKVNWKRFRKSFLSKLIWFFRDDAQTIFISKKAIK